MSRRSVTVIKVGGSLLDWPELPARLAEFLDRPACRESSRMLIAGGGGFVEELRRLDAAQGFGDESAHALALHAMDLTARVLARLGRASGCRVVESVAGARRYLEQGGVAVLAPRKFLQRKDSRLPRTWDVTSDSIAARVAVFTGATRLILLKSVSLPAGTTRTEAARQGLVDAHFPTSAQTLANIGFVNLRLNEEAEF